MIIDLPKFISAERPIWTELEKLLDHAENEPALKLNLEQLKRFHYLYERTSADLGKMVTFSSEPEIRRYLESLVARAYGEIHETRTKQHRLRVWHWFSRTFPQTFRRHARAFYFSVAVTIVGCVFGGLVVSFDPGAKSVLMPFSHLQGDPSKRVQKEESTTEDRLAHEKAGFSSMLMKHNIQVSIFTMALGTTWGVGTILMLFYNGVILGAVCLDYILAGQTKFLVGWLLPHGSFEIPAILIAGQAGLILGRALIGSGTRLSLKSRLRDVSNDLVTLIFGVAVLLIWAGIVEAFFSQNHEPVVPYLFKIAFGLLQLTLLILFLTRSGRAPEKN